MRDLDWSNEGYARLYRRTAAFLAMSWHARAVYHEVLHDLDRLGRVALGGLSPADKVAALCGYPPEVVGPAVEELIARGWLVAEEGFLVDPQHAARESASKSQQQRSRESRMLKAFVRDTKRVASDTNCDGLSRNVSPATQNVTDRHETWQIVTKRVARDTNCDADEVPRVVQTLVLPSEKITTKTKTKTKTLSGAVTEPPEDQVVMRFPVVGGAGREWPLTKERLGQLEEAFPAVDVLAEARIAKDWCIANPSRRKTVRGMNTFLSSWMARRQNRGGTLPFRQQSEGGDSGWNKL